MSQQSRARELARRLFRNNDKPRNPTASQRRAGAPRLSPEEWTILRDWQASELATLTNTPEAIARRAEMEREWAAGEPVSKPTINP